MARNLVKESEDIKDVVSKPDSDLKNSEGKEVVIVTTDQLIINNLNSIRETQSEMFQKMLEGFKQVGVKFD